MEMDKVAFEMIQKYDSADSLPPLLDEHKLLLVVDAQNDFISGSLPAEDGEVIINTLAKTVDIYKNNGYKVIYTMDSHGEDYLKTQEGRWLPIIHCQIGSFGWELHSSLKGRYNEDDIFVKRAFASVRIKDFILDRMCHIPSEICLCGFCTDICIISGAVVLKSLFPETDIKVIEKACGGTTREAHRRAIEVMKGLQINII